MSEKQAPTRKGGKDTQVKAPCTCTHSFQDKMYGKGIRIHTTNAKGDERRCTVCSTKTHI